MAIQDHLSVRLPRTTANEGQQDNPSQTTNSCIAPQLRTLPVKSQFSTCQDKKWLRIATTPRDATTTTPRAVHKYVPTRHPNPMEAFHGHPSISRRSLKPFLRKTNVEKGPRREVRDVVDCGKSHPLKTQPFLPEPLPTRTLDKGYSRSSLKWYAVLQSTEYCHRDGAGRDYGLNASADKSMQYSVWNWQPSDNTQNTIISLRSRPSTELHP
jgi:hypothetical protein